MSSTSPSLIFLLAVAAMETAERTMFSWTKLSMDSHSSCLASESLSEGLRPLILLGRKEVIV